MKIHDMFHTSLLRFAVMNFLIEQIQSSSLSIVINEEEEYEVNDILNNRYHYDKLQYKIVWIDYFSDKAWYSAENFQTHSKEILSDYHQIYFQKTESNLRLIVIIEVMLSQKNQRWTQRNKKVNSKCFQQDKSEHEQLKTI
jgi:hypothetical protein